MTKEIIIGLTTNIESQELRRLEYQSRGIAPEHPRASSTDDAEGLVGMLHDMFGTVFDHKTLLDQMPKVFNTSLQNEWTQNYPIITGHHTRTGTIPTLCHTLMSPQKVEEKG